MDQAVEAVVAALLDQPGEIAIGEDAGKPARAIDEHGGAGPPPRHAAAHQHLADRLALGGHAALLQRPHVMFHFAQALAQAAGGMEAGEILAAEIPHAADHQRQGIAHRQHRRRAAARGQAQGASLFDGTQFEHHVAARPSVLSARLVMATSGTPKSASGASSRTTSSVSPLSESISTTSSAWMRPRSP